MGEGDEVRVGVWLVGWCVSEGDKGGRCMYMTGILLRDEVMSLHFLVE